MTPTERRIRTRPKLREIVLEVVEARGLSLSDICSRRRTSAVVAGRHECWFHIRNELAWSYPEIGRLWGVDHTTVISGVKGWGP